MSGNLHRAGVTDIPLRAPRLTCGVLAGGSATGTVETTGHADVRALLFTSVAPSGYGRLGCCQHPGARGSSHRRAVRGVDERGLG